MNAGARQMRIRWGGASDRGLRRDENQDAMYADVGMFVVADGMGGQFGGSIASSLAVKTLAANSPSTPEEMLAAVRHANTVVHHRSTAHPDLTGMGTTMCAIAVVQNPDGARSWCLVNVGDSRVYRFRARNPAGELTQLTVDHNFVAEMLAAGHITAVEARTHKLRNRLTRAIGVGPEVNIDDWLLELSGNDRFLLCTDGLTNELNDDELAAMLSRDEHPSQVARALVSAANDRGGRDNSTALIVDVNITDADEAPSAGTGSGTGATPDADSVTEKPKRRWRRNRRR